MKAGKATLRRYRYIGDRFTDKGLKGRICSAVFRDDGRCIRGKNGSMLVSFRKGNLAVVVARLLRKMDRV